MIVQDRINETNFPNTSGGLSLVEELALIRVIARDCYRNELLSAYMKLCGIISSLITAQTNYESINVYTKEVCIYMVCSLIQNSPKHRSPGEIERLTNEFIMRLSDRWREFEIDIEADIALMDSSVPPLTTEYTPNLLPQVKDITKITKETGSSLQPYKFTRYNVPAIIEEETHGAAALNLLEEVSNTRALIGKYIIPLLNNLWATRGEPDYKQRLVAIVEAKAFNLFFRSLTELISAQINSIRRSIDVIEGIEFANVAISVLTEMQCEDVVTLIKDEFGANKVVGIESFPSD